MSSNAWLMDITTRHQVFLQRYAGGQANAAKATLNRLSTAIKQRLAAEHNTIHRNRLAVVLADVDTLSFRAFGEITEQALESSQVLVIKEAEFSLAAFDRSTTKSAVFTLPSEAALLMAVDSTALTVGTRAMTIRQTLKEFDTLKRAEIERTILDAIVIGENSAATATKVAEIIDTKIKREAGTIVRTVTNSVSNIARNETMLANRDIAHEYRWISTLDNRTTLICAGRDNETYEIGAGPLPPAHYNCRSSTVLVIDPKYNLGTNATGTRTARGESGTTERINSKTTYGGWLKKQPADFVDEALGKERSRLFRSGNLSIDKFTDPTGRTYTLEELERINPLAFA